MKRQSGFTLIELIIVIVILGILAVTAAPQFFNFGSDARASTVRGLEGSVQAASEMVHARAQMTNENTGNIDVREGVQVSVENFYATADEAGIISALNVGEDWDNDVADGSEADGVSADDLLIFPEGLSTDQQCFVRYRAATENAAPVIGAFTEEC